MQKIIRFRRWIAGGVAGILFLFLVAYEQHHAAEKYQHHRAEYCATLAASPEKQKACVEKGSSSRDYLPWWFALITWPEGITTLAILGTGFVIAWQSNETRRAANASERAAAVARRQTDMLHDKERAIVELMCLGLTLDEQYLPYWNLSSSLKIRNLGPSRAHINFFDAELIWHKREAESQVAYIPRKLNRFPDSYIDPAEDWNQEHSPTIYCLKNAEETTVDWFAEGVYRGDIRVILRASIEYRTYGTIYRRNFICEWNPSGTGVSGILNSFYNNTPPDTNADKVRSGGWHITLNEEYAVETETKPQNPN